MILDCFQIILFEQIKIIGVLLIISFLVSLSYLIRYNSIDRHVRDWSSSSSSSVSTNEVITDIDNKMYFSPSKRNMSRSDSSSNVTSHGAVSITNKDVYFVNPKQNYLVTFDQHDNERKKDRQSKTNKLQTHRKSFDPLPQHDSKKNLFILSIGSNNEFIKRIQMSNTNNTINE